jgi:hypothetical protein
MKMLADCDVGRIGSDFIRDAKAGVFKKEAFREVKEKEKSSFQYTGDL